jgi:hypothetical protein
VSGDAKLQFTVLRSQLSSVILEDSVKRPKDLLSTRCRFFVPPVLRMTSVDAPFGGDPRPCLSRLNTGDGALTRTQHSISAGDVPSFPKDRTSRRSPPSSLKHPPAPTDYGGLTLRPSTSLALSLSKCSAYTPLPSAGSSRMTERGVILEPE